MFPPLQWEIICKMQMRRNIINIMLSKDYYKLFFFNFFLQTLFDCLNCFYALYNFQRNENFHKNLLHFAPQRQKVFVGPRLIEKWKTIGYIFGQNRPNYTKMHSTNMNDFRFLLPSLKYRLYITTIITLLFY